VVERLLVVVMLEDSDRAELGLALLLLLLLLLWSELESLVLLSLLAGLSWTTRRCGIGGAITRALTMCFAVSMYRLACRERERERDERLGVEDRSCVHGEGRWVEKENELY
jgi:hypothetical protein